MLKLLLTDDFMEGHRFEQIMVCRRVGLSTYCLSKVGSVDNTCTCVHAHEHSTIVGLLTFFLK